MERRFTFNKKKVSNANKNRFYVNMRIVHVDFGTGTVVAVYDEALYALRDDYLFYEVADDELYHVSTLRVVRDEAVDLRV